MVLAKPQFPYTVIDKFLLLMTVLLLSTAPRYCVLVQYMFIIFFFIFTNKFSAGAQNIWEPLQLVQQVLLRNKQL